MANRITRYKKGDSVKILSGKYKNSTGKISKVITSTRRCVVEGITICKKHYKARSNEEKSAIIQKHTSIHLFNVIYYDEKTKKTSRITMKLEKNSKSNKDVRVRFAKNLKVSI